MKTHDTSAMVDDPFGHLATEGYPVLDLALDSDEFDRGVKRSRRRPPLPMPA
jgi:hypothetical protein